MKFSNITLFRLALVTLFLSLILAACGESQLSPTAVPSPTPYPTYTAQATQTAYPTYTPAATQTPYPTYTAVPTYTPTPAPTATPTPTPTPVPNIIELGGDDMYARLIRYDPSLITGPLESVKISNDLKSSFTDFFKQAQNLGVLPNKSNGYNNYLLQFESKFVQKLLTGVINEKTLPTKVVGGYFANIKKVPISWGNGVPVLGIFQLVTGITSLIYLDHISHQLDILKEDIAKIKDFLDQEKLSEVIGTFQYLQSIQKVVVAQKLDSSDAEVFRIQLEQIQKNSFALMDFAKSQMGKAELRFNQIKLDPNFWIFPNDEGLNKLKVEIDEFKRYSYVYLVALGGKGLGLQLRCTLPGNKDAVRSFLHESRQQLDEWKNLQKTFYTSIENRLGAIKEGAVNNTQKINQFKEIIQKGRLETTEKSDDLDKGFVKTLAQLNESVKYMNSGLDLVFELEDNDSGAIKQVSQVIKS